MVKTPPADAVLDHLLSGGRADASLRSLAAGSGVSHSLLLYHFGSRDGLLLAVHQACEQRQRDHLAALRLTGTDPVATMRAMWRHLADPAMWPLYRLGFTLGSLRTAKPADEDRDLWLAALTPLVRAVGGPEESAAAEAQLWLATSRGLLWELVTGADPAVVTAAAMRFFAHYDP